MRVTWYHVTNSLILGGKFDDTARSQLADRIPIDLLPRCLVLWYLVLKCSLAVSQFLIRDSYIQGALIEVDA